MAPLDLNPVFILISVYFFGPSSTWFYDNRRRKDIGWAIENARRIIGHPFLRNSMKKNFSVLTHLMMTAMAAFVISQIILTDSSWAKKTRKPSSLERPPQFVLLAFDGSKDLGFWSESVNFAESVKTDNPAKNNLMRFTYFVNPVYYLDQTHKSNYTTPGLNKSLSCIGWSDSLPNIPLRVIATNKAFLRGHEIGSHANAHCDQTGLDKGDPMYGHPWTQANWDSEFDQFNKILFNVFPLNNLKDSGQYAPTGFAFNETNIVGFRAPKLAVTDGLWPTLQKYKFRYDTSKVSAPTYWPQKQNWGGWNFPLAQIKIAGSTRSTLSMDYNWLVFQSAGASKPNLTDQEKNQFKKQMMDSYKAYFKTNYFGGRGPIHIGHHFSKWNRGAYWEVMQEFSKTVCSKPEVRCVTYVEYANWLDSLDPATYQAYRTGNFEKLPDDHSIKDIATPFLVDVRLDHDDKVFEAMVERKDLNHLKLMQADVQLQVNFETQKSNKVSQQELIEKFGLGKSVLIRARIVNKQGTELNWSTYKVNNLGTVQQTVSEPIEDKATEPEGSEAHNLEE